MFLIIGHNDRYRFLRYISYEYFQLPKILKSIISLELEGNISFDAKDAIFVTNKWDSIRCEVDDEKARGKTWDLLKKDIKRAWNAVREENIFRMSLIEVTMKSILVKKNIISKSKNKH